MTTATGRRPGLLGLIGNLIPDALLINPSFRRLFLSEGISTFGTAVSALAFPLLVLSTGGSAVQAGAITTVVLGTRLALRFPAGSLVDRWDPLTIMVSTDVLRFLALGSIPVVAFWGDAHFAHLVVVAAVDGIGGALIGPASGVLTRDVATDDQLSEAMGLGQIVQAVSNLAGPAVGGVLFAVAPMLPFVVDALSYAASAVLLVGLTRRAVEPAGEEDARGVLAGVRWLLRARPLLAVLLFSGVINLVGGAMDIMIVLDLRARGASPDVVGLVLSGAGVGAIVGSVLALPVTRHLRIRTILLSLGVVWAAAFAALAVRFTPWTAAAVLTLLMVLSPAAGVVVGTAVLSATPRHLLGRVGAATSVLISGLAVIGPLAAGALVQFAGPAGGWWAMAVVTGVLVVVGWMPLRSADELDRPPEDQPPEDQPPEDQSPEEDRSPEDRPAEEELEVVAHLAPDRPRDPFRRLEDPTDPDTVRWIQEQVAAFDQVASAWPDRQSFTDAVILAESRNSPESPPRPYGDRLFVVRLADGAEHPALAVIEPDGTRRVLVDPDRIDPTGATTLEAWHPSVDGALLAYQLAKGGIEDSALYVLDVGTGAVVDGPIDRVRKTSVAWLGDGSGFFYVRRPPGEQRYHRRVHRHLIGDEASNDMVIFGEGRDRTQHYVVRTDAGGRWLTIGASLGTSPRTDAWVGDATEVGRGEKVLRSVQDGVDARTQVYPRDEICYLLTDLDTRRGRLARCSSESPQEWVDVIAEDPEAVLADFAVLDDPRLGRSLLLISRVRHAVAELTVHRADGSLLAEVDLPECSSIGPLRYRAAGAAEAWFTVSGFGRPTTVYRFDAFTLKAAAWPAEGSPVSSEMRTQQTTYHSEDGTPVRMFVVSGPRSTRPAPTILTVYGGFGDSLAPAYLPEVAAWVEAGGVYAVASIRGGGEEGEDWHRAGMLSGKQNSIDDLHGAARHLIAEGWTTPEKLGIWGASNGGLMVAAAMVQRPDLYGAVVAVAPLLDMARYQFSGMGPSWVGEYGDAADPDQLNWLLGYSPYHNVREGVDYPPSMFMVFDGDSRVEPWHARKMCAALQAAGASPVFRLEMGSGHGQRSMSSQVGVLADLLAFFADHLR